MRNVVYRKCYELGHGVKKDSAKALELDMKVAQSGDRDMQFFLGRSYLEEDSEIYSVEEGVKWYRKAALNGDTSAMFELGNLYEEGILVDKDLAEAIKWYRLAAENRHSSDDAWCKMGDLYYYGVGVPQD